MLTHIFLRYTRQDHVYKDTCLSLYPYIRLKNLFFDTKICCRKKCLNKGKKQKLDRLTRNTKWIDGLNNFCKDYT